jgi:leader peptidase (prepilin peptidase)/N-methyltransferase
LPPRPGSSAAKPVALLYCGLVAALVALTMIDWDTTVLPDA